MLAALKEQYSKWKSGSSDLEWNSGYVRGFERKNLTLELAGFLDEIR